MSLTELQNMKPKMNHILGIKKIDIDDIHENESNLYEQRDIEELKMNIRQNGLLKPLEVYEDGDHYVLIGGHRRYNALLDLYVEDEIDAEVSCIIYPKPINDCDEKLQIITSNAQRNMSKSEMVEVTKLLLDILNDEPERRPKGVETRDWIAGYLGVCGKTAQGFMNAAKGIENKKSKKDSQEFAYVEQLLRNHYATKAKVTKNKLTLSYSGVEDLNRILELMNCLESSMEMGEQNV